MCIQSAMAPRSSGCRICVRRKVKCDETKPFCERCRKARLQCSGFREHLVFVDETRQALDKLAPVQTSEAYTSPASHPPLHSTFPFPALNFCRELRLFGDSDDVYFAYLLERFVATGNCYQDYYGNGRWILACLSKKDDHPAAHLALKCLATTFFGRQHHQESVVSDASYLYSQALRRLCQTLQDPQKAQTFDVLAATTALNLYEYIAFTSSRGWIHHAQGMAKLLELRGPQAFKDLPDRAILYMNKPILVAKALEARKRTFLEDEEWDAGYTSNDAVLILGDLFARLPGIAETIESFGSCASDFGPAPSKWKKTRTKISGLIDDLKRWYCAFVVDRGHLPKEFSTQTMLDITNDTEGPLFDTIFEFDNLCVANEVTMHDSIMIAALEWQHKLTKLSWQRGIDHEGMLEIPAASELAVNICRSVEYHLRPKHIQAGAFYILMPARTAYRALPKQSREARWLENILKKIADASGFEIARNMLDIAPTREERLQREELSHTHTACPAT